MPSSAQPPTEFDFTAAIIRDVLVVSPNASVRSVIERMSGGGEGDRPGHQEAVQPSPSDNRWGCALVVEGDRVIGILTDRDIVRLAAEPRSLETVIAREVMTSPAITLRESDFTDSCTIINRLQAYASRPIPVLDGQDHPVGVVTLESIHQALNPLEFYQLAAKLEQQKLCPQSRLANRSAQATPLKKQGEAHIPTLHTIEDLEAQNNLLAKIAKNEPLLSILNPLVETVERKLTGGICSLLLVDSEQRLRAGAAPTLPLGYSKAIDSVGVEVREGAGSCGTAAFRKASVIVTNIALDPLWQDYREIALSYGLKACWSSPVLASNGQVLGTFAVYYLEEKSPQPDELEFIGLMANIAGIAIERNLSEQALRESETRWQFALEGAGDGVWDWNLETNTVFFSSRWKAMLGYRDDEVGNSLSEWDSRVHPDDKEQCYADLNQHFSGKTIAYQNEHRLRCKDGSYKWILDRGRVMAWTSDGKPLRMIGTHSDISDRKATELILHEYERVIRTSTDGIALVDRDYTYRMVNPVYLRRTGKQRHEVIGHTIAELLGEAIFQNQVKPRLDRCLLGEVQQYEEWFDFPDQGRRFLRVTYDPYREVDGHISGAVVITHDLTALKQGEDQLRRNEAILLETQRIAHLGSWEMELPSQVITWSPELFRIFGLDPDQPPPSYAEVLNFIHPEDRTKLHQYVEQAIAEGVFYTIDYRVIAPDGSIRHHEGRGIVERDDQGRVTRLFGSALDITDRKLAQQQVQCLIEGTATTTGDDFFTALVSHIAQALNVAYAVVTELKDGHLHTLAFFACGELQPPMSYSIAKTPCEIALLQGQFFCETCVQRHFPSDIDLVEMGAESYLGIALRDKEGQAIGNLCILDTKPIQEPEWLENLLRVFAARAAAELERQRVTEALEHLNQDLEHKVEARTAALRASEKRYRALLDGASDAILLADAQGHLIEANQRAEILLGYSREEIAQLHMSQIHPPAVLDKTRDHFQRVVNEKSVATLESAILRKDGVEIPVEISGSFVEVEGERIAQGIFRDISERFKLETERKQAEDALRASERRYATLAASAPVAIFRFSGILNCTYVSDRWSEMTGRPVEAALGEGWLECIYPEDRDRLLTSMAEQQAQILKGTHTSKDFEGRHLLPDGSIRWFYAQVTPEIDADGSVVGYIGTLTDITERKQIEAELTESESKFRYLVEGSKDLIWTLDEKGLFTYLSPQFKALFGWEVSEYLGQPAHDLVHAEDVPYIIETFKKSLIQPTYPIEFRHRHKDGSYRWVRGTCSLIDEADPSRGLQGTLVDISDRKEIEETLQAERLRLQLALEAAQMGSWSCNFTTGRLIWSERAEAIFGYGPGTFPGDREAYKAMVHPADYDRVTQAIAHSFETGERYQIEYRIYRLDGEIRWIAVWGTITEDPTQGDRQIVGVVIDITDRKAAELALQESQAKYRRLAENIPGMLYRYVFHSDGTDEFTYASPRVQDIFECTPADATQDPRVLWSMVHPEDVKTLQTQTELSVKTLGRFETEFRILTPQGRQKWLQATSIPEQQSNGDIVWDGLILDISDRKAAETALQRSENRFRRMFDSSVVGMIFANFKGEILDANDRFLQMVGYARADLEAGAINWNVMTPPEHVPADLVAMEQLMTEGWINPWEKEYYRKDGSRVPVLIGAAFLPGTEDQTICVVVDISDRKKIERELRESKQFLQTVLDTFPLSVFWKDRNSVYLGGNRNFLQDAGLTSVDELIGKTDYEMPWANSEADFYRADDLRVMATNEANLGIIETQVQTDGKQIWLETNKLPLYNLRGEILGVLGTYQDITERKQAEEKFRQQATQNQLLWGVTQTMRRSLELETVLNATVQGIKQKLKVDRAVVYRFQPDWSGTFIAEAVDDVWTSLVNPDQPRIWEDTYLQETQGGRFRHQEPMTVHDIYTAGLQPCHVELLEQFQVRAFAIVPIFVGEALWGLLGVYQNSAPYPWPGWEIELLQQIAHQLTLAIQQANLYEQVQKELTERQQTQQQLTERNEQLAFSNEELARATRLKDEFLANMSHELRTPLNAILGMSEVLQEQVLGKINPRQIKAIETIERSGAHLLDLINDILDVSKIESGQIDLDFQTTAIKPLCESSLVFIKQVAFKKRIQLVLQVPDHLPKLWIDERRIRQVLINLLNNAVKFTPDGGQITLTVSPAWEQSPHMNPMPGISKVSVYRQPFEDSTPDGQNCGPYQFLRISVTDTGIGIAPEHQNKLFKPFIQIDSALNRQYTGTGLGLALVKRIVELHGGQVSLTSELGVGSCFSIELPISCQSTPVEEQIPPMPGLENAPPLSPAESPLIFLVEDNKDNISMFIAFLEFKGYRIQVAYNGQEALDLLQTQTPDLILMDIQMPGMDGLEAIRHIRHIPQLQEVPILALTALAMPTDRDRCLAAGANEYLPKPVQLKALLQMIQDLLPHTLANN